ncbi:MAG TPA: aminotransferase class V-fold PLP-dependent enzyme, partial [Spirochaetota bacterium]|nr:aminotransferase class V-fold PLP-dependent enzyme [Spirochaetota bacterium]
MSRIYNFAAGPSTLPLPALEEAAAKLVDYEGAGMSLIEMSHRGKIYDAIHNETVTLLRNILLIPDDFDVLFLQGGATMQFGMIPMAFLKEGATADFVLTGSWALRAVEDARLIGKTRVLWDGEDNHYTRIPSLEELAFNNDAAYVHICSNETIGGIQWQDFPDTGDVPLIADMSSDILSRPLPWDKLD